MIAEWTQQGHPRETGGESLHYFLSLYQPQGGIDAVCIETVPTTLSTPGPEQFCQFLLLEERVCVG